MGRVQDAEESYKKAIALKPDYWDGYNSLANFYDRQSRYAEAVNQYRRVIELTPDNPAAYNNLGTEYQSMDDPGSAKQAEDAFKKSLTLSPTYAAYANLGNLYMGERRYAEAVDMTKRALKLNDGDYRVWINLLLNERWLKEEANASQTREKAQSLLEAFLSEHPQDAIAQSWLAVLQSETHLRKKSQEHLEAALAISPNDPLVLANVAETYENLGDRARALDYAGASLKSGFAMSDLQSRPGLEQVLSDKSFHASGKK